MSTSTNAAYWLDRERFVVARLAVVTDPRTRRELERALVVRAPRRREARRLTAAMTGIVRRRLHEGRAVYLRV